MSNSGVFIRIRSRLTNNPVGNISHPHAVAYKRSRRFPSKPDGNQLRIAAAIKLSTPGSATLDTSINNSATVVMALVTNAGSSWARTWYPVIVKALLREYISTVPEEP